MLIRILLVVILILGLACPVLADGGSPEHEWFAAMTVRDIAEMRDFIAQKKPSTARSPVPPDTVLRRLSDGSVGALYAENRDISAALTSDPANPQLHEEAALLLWCFGALDASDEFQDIRFSRARMSAHLALAHDLRGDAPMTFCGKLAGAALAGTKEAAAQLASDASTPTEKTWVRIIAIVANHDGKLIDKDNFTPFEEYVSLCATLDADGPETAAKYLYAEHSKPAMRWLRLINMRGTAHIPASLGRVATVPYFRSEMSDFSRDASLWGKRDVTSWSRIAPDLNQEPTRCVVGSEMQVISYADICWWHQRQLLHAFECLTAISEKLGNKDADLQKLGREKLASLRLYPFVECTQPEFDDTWQSYIPKAVEVATGTPQLVPTRVWMQTFNRKGCEELARLGAAWLDSHPATPAPALQPAPPPDRTASPSSP